MSTSKKLLENKMKNYCKSENGWAEKCIFAFASLFVFGGPIVQITSQLT